MLNQVIILYKDHFRLTLLVGGSLARKTYIYWLKKSPFDMKEYESFEGRWVEGSIEKPIIFLNGAPEDHHKIDVSMYVDEIEIIYQIMGVSRSGKMSWSTVSEEEYNEFMKKLDY